MMEKGEVGSESVWAVDQSETEVRAAEITGGEIWGWLVRGREWCWGTYVFLGPGFEGHDSCAGLAVDEP